MRSDFRIDNLFRDQSGQVAIIDWENIFRGRGPVDLALFTLASLSTDNRRANEQVLLRAYVQAIRDAGFEPLGFAASHDSYVTPAETHGVRRSPHSCYANLT